MTEAVILVHQLTAHPAYEAQLAETARHLCCLVPDLPGSAEVAALPEAGGEVAERAAPLSAGSRTAGDLHGLLEHDRARGVVTEVHGRDADVVQRVGAELVIAELLGHRQPLAAHANRLACLRREHQEPGDMADDEGLRPRQVEVRHDLPRDVEMLKGAC